MTSHLEKLINKVNILKNYFDKNSQKLLGLFILIYITIFSIFCLFKFFSFNYIGLDLAIFNQVFYNSSQGNLFALTIHPHLYLGDHFALIIPLLLPFYLIYKSPVSLLILQTVILALGAWPLYYLARLKFKPGLSLFISAFYLTNLFVHNINSYEFHILPFAIPLLFLLFYFYQKNRFKSFLSLFLIILLIREDLALVIFMFGILSAIEKRKWPWILFPALFSSLWFIFALKMTGLISGYGHYKFVLYYGWLGNNIKEIILAIINHPYLVLKHIFSWPNISFLIGLFLPFAFLPLLKPKYLLPAFLIIMQILFLTAAGALALEIHYTALILPFLFIALIYALDRIFNHETKNKLLKSCQNNKAVFLIILFLIGVYSSLTVGPAYYLLRDIFNYPKIKEEISLRNYYLKQIPADTSVATGFHFIPQLSSRKKIYSLHYQYLGKKQYSDIPYHIPETTQYLLFDLNDFLYYQFLYRETDENNIKGAERIRELISKNYGLINYIDKFLLYKKNEANKIAPPYKKIKVLPDDIKNIDKNFGPIALKGIKSQNIKFLKLNNHQYKILPVTLYWQSLQPTKVDYQIKLIFENNKGTYEKNYPLSAFYPTHDWQLGEKIAVNYYFLVPEKLKSGKYKIKISVYQPKGKMGLNKSKIFQPYLKKVENLGKIEILEVNL